MIEGQPAIHKGLNLLQQSYNVGFHMATVQAFKTQLTFMKLERLIGDASAIKGWTWQFTDSKIHISALKQTSVKVNSSLAIYYKSLTNAKKVSYWFHINHTDSLGMVAFNIVSDNDWKKTI